MHHKAVNSGEPRAKIAGFHISEMLQLPAKPGSMENNYRLLPSICRTDISVTFFLP
jgi:hypothetical protein